MHIHIHIYIYIYTHAHILDACLDNIFSDACLEPWTSSDALALRREERECWSAGVQCASMPATCGVLFAAFYNAACSNLNVEIYKRHKLSTLKCKDTICCQR